MTTHKCKRNNASAAKLHSPKPNPLTSHIKIVELGESRLAHQFIKLSISVAGSVTHALVRIDNLASNRNTIFERLNQQRAYLIDHAAQNELIKRIQAYGPRTPSFRVVEEIGLFDDCFILPDRTIPALPNGVEKCLNDIPDDIVTKHRTAGTATGWKELAKYASGNSRMMFALALNFVGPVSAIWPRQFVAFQFTGDARSGKSSIAVVSTSTWGWDEKLGEKYGFGTSWNTTTNQLEAICKGYNHTILFLDKTDVSERKQKQSVDILEAIMRLDAQVGKGRMTDDGPRRDWSMPILSTSNISVAQMVKVGGRGTDPGVYCDRLIDIPCPREGFGMFEKLHEYRDAGEFSKHLKKLASEHHGRAGREFASRILKKRAEDEHQLLDFLDARENFYKTKARTRIASSGDLTRVHDKFATVYAAGRLAIREGILPFKVKDFLGAILACEEGHVRLVEKELAGTVQSQRPSIEILCTHIQNNRHTFVDLKNHKPPPNHDHASCPGYINRLV